MNDQNNTPEAAPSVQQQLGEISTIREILMGGHINQYEAEFNQIKQRIAAEREATDHQRNALEQHLLTEINGLEVRINDRLDALNQQMNDRFERLEAHLAAEVAQLHERIAQVSKTDKADLGRLLAEVSNRLING